MRPSTSSSSHKAPGPALVVFSSLCQAVLGGGLFDARTWFKKPKATGNAEKDEDESNTWRNKVKLLDLLAQKPSLVAGTLNFVEDKMMGASPTKAQANKEAQRWPNTYITWERIPKYWRAEFSLRGHERIRPHDNVLACAGHHKSDGD